MSDVRPETVTSSRSYCRRCGVSLSGPTADCPYCSPQAGSKTSVGSVADLREKPRRRLSSTLGIEAVKSEVVGAFILSPLVAAMSGDMVLSVGAAITGGYSEFGWLSALIAFVAYPVVLIFGFPVFMLLQRKKWLSTKAFILSGLFLSFIGLVIVITAEQHLFVGERGAGTLGGALLLAVVSGIVGGWTFMKVSQSGVRTTR